MFASAIVLGAGILAVIVIIVVVVRRRRRLLKSGPISVDTQQSYILESGTDSRILV
jgi:hypothetical protein